ncbi:hypothetical protein DEO72_LG10g1412 [Vigna unguiculata]|uniref:Uncharacterized protein n=1 Tax=Vigna unguiculata TaxID=3917 RepID=A0A4D6N8V4_VIGUN|nr:hypothetical protein DEO72_LG10g1412 [Vigna unguiculata]
MSTQYPSQCIFPALTAAFLATRQATTSENKSEPEHETCSSLTQARSPRSSERGSLAQVSPFRLGESSSSGIVASTISRLGETSSPERDYLSLKTKACHLSDNSSRNPRRAYASLP